jgi:hypothetical protein
MPLRTRWLRGARVSAGGATGGTATLTVGAASA